MNTFTIAKNFVLQTYQEEPSARKAILRLFPGLFANISIEENEKLGFGIQGSKKAKDLFINIAKKLGLVYNSEFQSENDHYDIYFSYYWGEEFYGPSYSYSSCEAIDLEEHFAEAVTRLLEFIKPSQC